MGLDLSGWLDNNPDFTLETESGVTVHLQDKWEYSDIIPLKGLVESKYEFVVHMLEKARDGAREEWFINFMSAVGDPVKKGGSCGESRMNPTVRSKFDWGIKKRYGIIPMDYPELPKDSDLVALMIGCNIETYNPYKTETSLMSLKKNILDTDFPTPIKEMLQENDNDKLHYLMGRQILEAHHETEPGSESIKDEFVKTSATLVTKAFTAFDICPLDKYI
ncbi:hypothetical protein DID88_008852 [Monilinia fructigena]|uniref:Uncharacterized protein n=1 Tax=Monilinia fructigena TaxID=38457 RepID=A0A395J6R2_9HELO|nr:hypothetical protein DID88_008852 [Monilinia fructigena]